MILVDWSAGAGGLDYFKAASNTQVCGTEIAFFLLQNRVNASLVHCIGHSLGAHACGYAGKVVKLGRISGLDPAGPNFKGQPSNKRLDKNDAL